MLTNKHVSIKSISWDTIYSVWSSNLWPGRLSPIEPHSYMSWPYSVAPNNNVPINEYPVSYLGCFVNNNLVGVNSGHQTSASEYRTRGLWVDPNYRRCGYATELFRVLEFIAACANCTIMWSIPRETALTAYTAYGFIPVGNKFKTETAESNTYAFKEVSRRYASIV